MVKRNRKTLRSPVIAALLLFLAAAGLSGLASAATLTEGQIRTIVKSHIEKNMQWDPAAFRIEFPVPLAAQEFKGKHITWQVQERRSEEFIGESVFNVKFYEQGIYVRELPVPVKMETALDVLVSTKPLSRETVIGSDDVKLIKKWYVRIPSSVLTDSEEAIGKILTQSIRANGEITKTMLKTPLMIRRGNLVKIIVESGSLEVTTVGLSEDNGGRGDIVRVKNLSSNKIIYAKVVDQALVRVDF